MKKRLFALMLSGILTMSFLSGCSDEDWDEEYEDYEEEYEEGSEEENVEDEQDKQNTSGQNASGGGIRGIQMSVGSSDGELSITRAESTAEPVMGDEGVWTIFVYLCGTDLESFNGMGTADFEEMMNSQSLRTSENVWPQVFLLISTVMASVSAGISSSNLGLSTERVTVLFL